MYSKRSLTRTKPRYTQAQRDAWKAKNSRGTYRPRLSRSIVSNPNTIYKFKRTASVTLGYSANTGFTTLVGTNYGSGIGIAFTLTGPQLTSNLVSPGLVPMPNITDFTTLFDSYRITGVGMKIFYTNNISNNTAAVGSYVNSALPTLQFCPDDDDNIAPSSNTELLQRPSTIIKQLGTNGPIKLYVPNPKLSMTVGTTGGTGTASPNTGWVDCNNVIASYYGYKIWLETFGGAALMQGYFQIYFTYYISLKGVR